MAEAKTVSVVGQTRDVLINIQALRGLAALLVVLFHLKELGQAIGLPQRFLSFAALGVDLFFVISGFIMVFTTDAARTGGLRFFKNRVARVVPLYWVITLLVFGIALLAPTLLNATRADPLNLMRSLFFVPYARDDGQMLPLMFLGWSLNYEMFFYLIFALALWLGRERHLWVAISAIFAFLAAGFVFQPQPGSIASFYTNLKMLEFAAGMLIARALPHLPRLRGFAIAGLLVGFAWLIVTPLMLVGSAATLSATGACSLILIAALSAERGGVVARWPLLILLGDASYSLYLIHPLVTQPAVFVWRRFLASDPLAALAVIPLAVLLAILLAVIIYRCVETPLSKAARKLLSTRRQDVPALGL